MRTLNLSYDKEKDQIEVEYQNYGGPTWWLYIDANQSRSYYVYDEFDHEADDIVEGDFSSLISDALDGFFDVFEIWKILKKHEDIHPRWD